MGFVKRNQTEIIVSNVDDINRDLATILSDLDNENSLIRRTSVGQLIEYPEVLDILIKKLVTEKDAAVRNAIFSTLTHIGGRNVIDAFCACLRSEDVSLRNEAIEALALMPDEIALVMDDLLTDNDSDVRILSINILLNMKHSNIESWLINVILNDDHINVCATALDLLVEVGTAASIEPIQHLKEKFNQDPYITFSANMAINRIQGE